MTTYFGKSCSFGLLCVSLVNVYQRVCPSFPFGFDGWMWDLIVSVPDHCLSFNLGRCGQYSEARAILVLLKRKQNRQLCPG